MGTIDSELDGGRDLREVIRAEFARLDTADAELVDRLEAQALVAADTEPETRARIALAVVEGAHQIVAGTPPATGPTVGQLSARQLLAAALRPRRTTGSRS
ncbi:hypothetical protein [Nocardioides endophyticus]